MGNQNTHVPAETQEVGCDGGSCGLLISKEVGGGSGWKCGSRGGPELSRVSATVSSCSSSLSDSMIQGVCLLGT